WDPRVLADAVVDAEDSVDGMCGVYCPRGAVRLGRSLAAGLPGPGPPRSLRRAPLPLRHPAAVVPEEPGAAGGGAITGRAAERPRGVHGRRRAGRGFDALRTCPADPGGGTDDL